MTVFSPEQLSAIESSGGVLVSAGAGSGKTAVLIEHLIHWMKNCFKNSSVSTQEISSELKRLAVITFTVKASEEMKMRLYERIEEIQSNERQNVMEENSLVLWTNIKKSLHHVYIGTIDGLFSKILKNNLHLLPISVPFEIVSQQAWEDKIQNMFWSWCKSLEESTENKLAHIWSKKFINWAMSIMGNTNYRLHWLELLKQPSFSWDFFKHNTDVIENYFLGQEWKESIQELISSINTLDVKKYQDKKWFQFIQNIAGLNTSHEKQIELFTAIQQLTIQYKGLRGPTGDDLVSTAQCLKKVRELVKEYTSVIEEWNECIHDQGNKVWDTIFLLTRSFYHYLEDNYGRNSGFCFADLSYYANQILQNEIQKLESPYYVVVDELQDTSMLQLQQIYLLAGKDAKNLYGVGDVKQAIYGFRGGESQVFFQFQKIVKDQKIDLFDNYRSSRTIVDFNNKLFSTLFTKTKSLDQIAKSEISVADPQVGVEVIQWDISKEEKVPDWQQELLEFNTLIEHIKHIVHNDSGSSIAVLFRTNEQIKKFASLMCQEKLSFTVQWKVAFEEDPLFLLFQSLMFLGNAKDEEKDCAPILKILKYHLSLVSAVDDIQSDLFFGDWKLFDAYSCFVRYLDQLGIAIAYQSPFLGLLQIKSFQNQFGFKDFLRWQDDIKDDEVMLNWTLPFDAVDKLNITLQTIHASKGLQYDHVLLARISSNSGGNKRSDTLLGENSPYSFKELTFLKNGWKSPQHYKENLEKKENTKDESLRLFYVACTRAKKSLMISLASSVRSETWGSLVLDLAQSLQIIRTRTLDDKTRSLIQRELRLLPIFQSKIYKDWRQYFSKEEESKQELKLIPSLSVTSLVVYERCPQKYYFQNILGLEQHFASMEKSQSVSSSKRGIKVHAVLQNYLTDKLSYHDALEDLDGDAAKYFQKRGVSWKEQISGANDISIEHEIRFSWKGNIVLGTPDLYFYTESGELHVWDFKTGHVLEDDLSAYLLQLKWYAYAIVQKAQKKDESHSNLNITLKVLMLDDQKEVQIKTNYDQVHKELKSWWLGFSNYSTKKLNHCSKCSYQLYCDKNA